MKKQKLKILTLCTFSHEPPHFFSACVKAGGWCRSTWCRTGASAYHHLQKRTWHLRLINHVRMCAPTALEIGGKRLATLFWRFDPASSAARQCFFFFFFTVDRTTNRVQTPSLPYESSFVCPRCVKFWDDPLLGLDISLVYLVFMFMVYIVNLHSVLRISLCSPGISWVRPLFVDCSLLISDTHCTAFCRPP